MRKSGLQPCPIFHITIGVCICGSICFIVSGFLCSTLIIAAENDLIPLSVSDAQWVAIAVIAVCTLLGIRWGWLWGRRDAICEHELFQSLFHLRQQNHTFHRMRVRGYSRKTGDAIEVLYEGVNHH